MTETSYSIRSKAKYEKRKKQVRKNVFLLFAATLMIAAFIAFFASISIQASDQEHQPSYKYYKSIQLTKGDTLWSIAEEHMDEHYGSTSEYIREVKRMNSLTSDKIICGSYLIVPYFSTEYKADAY